MHGGPLTIMMRFYVDGIAVDRSDFTVSGTDEGFTAGFNVFETLRTYNGQLFRPGLHADRLRASAEAVGLPCPSHETLLEEWHSAITGLRGGEFKMRMTLTHQRRLTHVEPLDIGRVCAPLRVVTREWEPSKWLHGRIKHGSRLGGEVARRAASVDEVFWVGGDGCLNDATRSSIFAALDGVMATPRDDGRILNGVTRGALLDAGREAGIEVREMDLPRSAPFSELYATSTLKELAPVTELDGAPAPGDGPLGDALVDAYHELVNRECPPR